MNRFQPSLWVPRLLLVASVLLLLGSGLVRHGRCRAVPTLDEATYLNASLLLANRFGTHLVDLPMHEFTLSIRYYPPLHVAALLGAFELFGYQFSSVLAVSWLLGVLALFAVYRVGCFLGDRWTGGLAAFLLACFPAFSNAATGSFMDFAMACWAAMAFAFLVGYSRHGKVWMLLGWTASVAAGQATRWTFVVFVFAVLVPQFVFGFLRRDGEDRSFQRTFALPALGAMVGFLPFLIWLALYGEPAVLFFNTGSETSGLTYDESVAFYLRAIFVQGIGPWLTLLLAFVVLNPRAWKRPGHWGLVVWVVVCLLVFSGIARKRAMYVLYVYPAVALLLAVGLHELRLRALRVPLGLAAVVLAGVFAAWTLAHWPRDDTKIFDEVFATLESSWSEERPPRVGIHRAYYADAEPFNALVFSFQNVAQGQGAKIWLEHSAVLEHAGHACDEDTTLDFLVLACTTDRLENCSPMAIQAAPPAVPCTDLTYLDAFPANHRGERFEGWIVVFEVEAG